MKINRDWLFNVLMNEEVGAGGSTTSVETAEDSTAPDTGAENVSGVEAAEETDGEGSQTAPDTYADFVMPEGVPVDSVALEQATPLFKEMGLTQEQAQKLVDVYAKQVQASSQSQVDAFNQLMNDWQEQARNDKEFGGDKFEENIKVAQAAVAKFGTPGLKQLLEEHGVGNHPEVIRFMVKVGRLTAEDVPGSTQATGARPQDRVNLLYPNDRNA